LCVIEVFFENDANNTISVKPIIERYAHFIGLKLNIDARDDEKWREWSITDCLKSIVEMDAAKREQIFNQKILSSLTILLELMAKAKIEVLEDVVLMGESPKKIEEFRRKLEQKGYLKKFNDAMMRDIFGKDVAMKRKKDDKQVGVEAPLKSVAATVIQTSTRKIQLFPAVYGAAKWGVLTLVGIIVSFASGILGVIFFGQHDGLTSLNCYNYAQQVSQQASQYAQMGVSGSAAGAVPAQIQDICSSNSNFQAVGIIFVVLTVLAVGFTIFVSVRLVKMLLHNQFASAHNGFELTHFQLTNSIQTAKEAQK
jgi:hypothetical protein